MHAKRGDYRSLGQALVVRFAFCRGLVCAPILVWPDFCLRL